jgi:hypothetical protein
MNRIKSLTPANVSDAEWNWVPGEHFVRAEITTRAMRAYTVICPLTGGGVSVTAEQGKSLGEKSYYSGIVVRDFRRLRNGSYQAMPAENL